MSSLVRVSKPQQLHHSHISRVEIRGSVGVRTWLALLSFTALTKNYSEETDRSSVVFVSKNLY